LNRYFLRISAFLCAFALNESSKAITVETPRNREIRRVELRAPDLAVFVDRITVCNVYSNSVVTFLLKAALCCPVEVPRKT
jgi:hypothetical protein